MKTKKNKNLNNNAKEDWVFSGNLYKQFDDHIYKSIPNLNRFHEYIVNFSEWFAVDGSCVYDLGSSTGNLLKKINHRNNSRNIYLNGIEVVEEMRKSGNYENGINFINEDIISAKLNKSDYFISCFTMQFIKKKDRDSVYKKIYNSINEGGCFMLAEKVKNKNSYISEIKKSILFEEKVRNGLKESDVLKKDISLRGVMNLDYELDIYNKLLDLGFSEVDVLFKDNEFVLFCAIK